MSAGNSIQRYGNTMTVRISDGQNELLGPSKEIDFGRLQFPYAVEGILQDDVSLSFKQEVAPSNLGDVLVKGVGGAVKAVGGILQTVNPEAAVGGAMAKAGLFDKAVNATGIASSLDSEAALNSALKFAGLQYAQTGGLTRQYPVKTTTSMPAIKLKWYMPYGELEVIKNMLMLIGAIYPTDAAGHLERLTKNSNKSAEIIKMFNTSLKDVSTPLTYGLKNSGTSTTQDILNKVVNTILNNGVVDAVTTGVASMSSPVLKVDVAGWMTFSPVYLTSLRFELSRNTYDRLYGDTRWTFPVTVSANLGFDWAMTPVMGATENAYKNGAEALSVFGNILAGKSKSESGTAGGTAKGWGKNFYMSDLISLMESIGG